MACTFVVYVDESGDEGFLFGKGSSQWFVLSAAVFRAASEREQAKLVDEVRSLLKKEPATSLHFRRLKHHQRVPYVDRIAKARLRCVSVLVHKPSLLEPEKFREKYRLYFYATRYLLERVSWLCREARRKDDAGDGSADIVFSNRGGMSYEDVRDYIARLQTRLTEIDWTVIKTNQMRPLPHDKRMGLQIADAVASSHFVAVQPDGLGYTEDRFVRMLKPVVWHRKGRYLGLGLKFWPKEVLEKLDFHGNHAWVQDYQ